MPYSSRTETRDKERKHPVGRTRGPVEEPRRAPSVQILNSDDKRDQGNGASDQASDQGRLVVEAAKAWLQSLQWIEAERQHQINQSLLKEAHGGLSNQEKLSSSGTQRNSTLWKRSFESLKQKGPKSN